MTPLLRHANGTLFVDNTQLQAGAVAETYLTADCASTTLTVKNILGFGINQILLIEDLGTENAEIILTHASSAPSGTTVTLVGSLVKTHVAGSKVRVIAYNQFELKRGTTTVAASATALTVATTADFNPVSSLGSGLVAVDPTLKIQVHESSEHTSGYYFARYKNSITSDFSGYTDAVAYGGWATNTVGYMIDNALSDMGYTLSEKLTRLKCYSWINECLKLVQGKQVRWPGLYEFNYIAGQTTRGVNTVTMPTDAYDTETTRSVLAIRIGDTDRITLVDPVEYEQEVKAVTTTSRTQATAAAVTLTLSNSYDFADSGTVHVYVSGTQYAITYTAVTRDTATGATGALTGVPASGTGSITVTIPAGTNVWQNEEEGTPTIATVRDGVVEFYPLPSASDDNQNVYLDYALIVTDVNSDGDTIDLRRFDIVNWYLKWRIEQVQKNDGKLDQNSGYYMLYKETLNDAIRTAPTQVSFQPRPRINTMRKR